MLRSIRARWAGAKTDNKRAVVGIICLIGVLSIVVIATVSEYQLIHSFKVIPIPEDRPHEALTAPNFHPRVQRASGGIATNYY